VVRPYVVANINPGEIRWECAARLGDIRAANVPVIGKISGPYLDIHRNDCVMAYMTDPDLAVRDWLIFIDSDCEATVDDLDTLIDVPDDVSVVSGVYASLMKDHGFRTVVYKSVELEPDDPEFESRLWRMIPYEFKHLVDLPGHPSAPHLKAVDGFGAGCLAVHRRVFAEMLGAFGFPMPWFYCAIVSRNQEDKPQWIGEDFGFGFRARQLGYTLYCNTLVQIPHYKVVKIVPDPDKALVQL